MHTYVFIIFVHVHTHTHTNITHKHTDTDMLLTHTYTVVTDTGFQEVLLTFNEANFSDLCELFFETEKYVDIVHTCPVPVTHQ